ncbi:MAG: NAD-dependent epimerase/dehydratase family protein [Candidatus Omnitrophica bacterium]|nr:NAD-dependent epimerase/dehydratase family protein [Candidatus Omnitrophota bacterium]
MRILVTGGAGFIASHLVDGLVAAGHRVTVLDNFDPQVHQRSRPAYLNPRAEYVTGEVQDRSALERLIPQAEVLYHQAAAVGVGQSMYQIAHYMQANTQATAVLLDVLVNTKAKLRKLIVASSMSIYGEGLYRCVSCGPVAPQLRQPEQLARHEWEARCPRCGRPATPIPTTEDKPRHPTSIYALSKQDQEAMCLLIGTAYKIPTVALRYFNVYGPRQSLSNPYTGVCAIFSSRIKNGHAPLIYEDGLQSRDFIHVADIVQANLLALERPEADGQVFNVGTGTPTTILDIARVLAKLYGSSVAPQIVGKYRTGDIRHCIADVSRLQALGFQPAHTLETGLRDLVAWGKATEAVDRVDEAAQELEARGLCQG